MPQIALRLWAVVYMFTQEQMFSAQEAQHSFSSRETRTANSSSLGSLSQQSDSQGEGHSVSLAYLHSGSFHLVVHVPACTAPPPPPCFKYISMKCHFFLQWLTPHCIGSAESFLMALLPAAAKHYDLDMTAASRDRPSRCEV